MALADESLEDKLEFHRNAGVDGIPRDELLEYLRQAAKGLDFLNEPRHAVNGEKVGIVHRDVKPANLLLLGDSVVVGDFGVATSLREFDEMATELVGSLGFMAPESIARRPTSTTDQYALAISYYYLRTGEMPYGGEHTFDSLAQLHKEGRLDFGQVEGEEHDVLRKATALPPLPRYDSCAEFVAALADASQRGEIQNPPNRFLTFPVVATLVVATAFLAAFGWWLTDRNKKKAIPNPGMAAVELSRELTFWPADTEFELQTQSVGNNFDSPSVSGQGSARIGLNDFDRIQVSAKTNSTVYMPIEKKIYNLQQLDELGWEIRLVRRSVVDIRAQAFELIKSDRWAEAVSLLTGALSKEGSVLDFPQPRTCRHDHEVISLSPGTQGASYSVVAINGERQAQFRFSTARSDEVHEFPKNNWIDSNLLKVRESIQLIGSGQWLVLFSDAVGTISDDGDFIKDEQTDEDTGLSFTAFAMSENGEFLAAGDSRGKVHLWSISMDGLGQHQSFDVHEFSVANLVFDRTSTSLMSVGLDCSLKLLTISSPHDVQISALGTPVSIKKQMLIGATLAAQDRVLLATEDQLFLAHFSPGSDLQTLDIPDVDGPIGIVESTVESPWVLIGTESISNPATLFNIGTQQSRLPVDSKEFASIAAASFSSDGHWLAATTYFGHLWIADLSAETPRWQLLAKSTSGHRRFVCFTPDNKFLVTVLESKNDRTGTEEIWAMDQCQLIIQAKNGLSATTLEDDQ